VFELTAPDTRSLATDLIHHPYTPPGGFAAPQPAVAKASTVFFPTVAAMREFEWKDKSAYTYGLHGTPTTYTLEERLCTLEGWQPVPVGPERFGGHRHRITGPAQIRGRGAAA
jgi:cystathionine beta-lyase/cystathionine gamma-synthase